VVRVAESLTAAQVRRYLTKMKTRVSTKGQIVLPSEVRELDAIEAGQEFQIERLDRGDYRLTRVDPPANEGLVSWLLDCPEKDYFVAIESESTDEL
jgi:AbrB family looped-hinge helix DNA binding protein